SRGRPPPTSCRCGRPPPSSASPTRRPPCPPVTAPGRGCPLGEAHFSPAVSSPRGGPPRPPVRARGRAVHLGEADLQPAGLPRPPRGAGGGHAVRPGDLLAGLGRLGGGPDRGGGGGHGRRLRGHHQVPGRGAAGRRPALLDQRRAPGGDPRGRVPPQQRAGDAMTVVSEEPKVEELLAHYERMAVIRATEK